MKMLVTIKRFLCVISIMFLSLVQSNPTKLISTEMVYELNNCTSLPEEVRLGDNFMSLCAIVIPKENERIGVKFSFDKYICMELLDVSLQLCDPKFARVNFTKIKEDFKMISSNLAVENFCSKLKFPNTRVGKYNLLADVAIEHLKDSKNCEKYCVDGEVNPLCRAIFWANQYLIAVIHTKEAMNEVSTSSDNASANSRQVPDSEVKARPIVNVQPSIAIVPTVINQKDKVEVDTMPKPEDNRTENVNIVPPSDQSSSVVATTQQKNEKMSEKPSPPESPLSSSSPVSPTIPSPVSDSSDKVMDTFAEDHESSDPFKSRGGGDDDSIPPLYENEEVESKGPNVEGNLPQSVLQVENYGGETDEGHPSLANSLNKNQGQDTFVDAQDSHFFAYFLTMVVICIVGYLVFHNKQKIIALALEGRRMQGSRRRPNTSSYKKLDSNLEEAVTSTCASSSVTHVIF